MPQKWEELTPSQFLLVSRFYLQEMDESSFLKEFYSLPSGVIADGYYRYKLSELIEFISDCRVRMDRFILSGVSGLKAPGERLKGMCFEHFMHVDTAFNRYARDGKDASLAPHGTDPTHPALPHSGSSIAQLSARARQGKPLALPG